MRKDKKGFTLAELLVVVAIIGVLVAISIPIFTSQLKKARLAVNQANARAAYTAASAIHLDHLDAAGFGNQGNTSYWSFVYDTSTGKAELVTSSLPSKWDKSKEDWIDCYDGKSSIDAWDLNSKGKNSSSLCDKVYKKWKIDIGNGTSYNGKTTKLGELYAVCWQVD